MVSASQNENLKSWIELLRDKKNKQCAGTMYILYPDRTYAYCATGLFLAHKGLPLDSVVKSVGVIAAETGLEPIDVANVVTDNDAWVSFAAIAYKLEKKLKERTADAPL